MSDGKPSAKWEAKQRAAKKAEAKFAANQARAANPRKRAARPAAPAAVASPSKKLGPVKWLLAHKAVLAVVVVLVTGGVIFGVCKVVKHQLRNAPGSPRDELLVAGTLIVMDHVEIGGTDSKGRAQNATATGQRLTALDATTGAQLAVQVGEYARCYPGGSRVACVDIYDRLDLLDPRTLDVTHTAAELISAAKLAKPTRRIERDGEAFVVVLEDGRGARIDPAPATPTVTELDSVRSQLQIPANAGCETAVRITLGATTLSLDSAGTRARLTTIPPPPAESSTPGGRALTFLEPRFLATPEGLPLILHRAALGEDKAQLISRVDGISRETWQVPLEGECRKAYVHGSTLVVATDNPARRAIGIDVGSGRVAWTFGR